MNKRWVGAHAAGAPTSAVCIKPRWFRQCNLDRNDQIKTEGVAGLYSVGAQSFDVARLVRTKACKEIIG